MRRFITAVAIVAFAAAIARPAAAQDPPSEPATTAEGAPSNPQTTEAAEDAIDLPERLLDRAPFDRITLDSDNNSAVIETVLLDLPGRRIPDPLTTEGTLELFTLSQPSIPYSLAWSTIAKIELYEQLLLAEAVRLTGAGEFAEAFEYLAALRANYPDMPGLEAALQAHLWRDAGDRFAVADYDGAWPALRALYDRNPDYPKLAGAVEAVVDALVERSLDQRDHAAARAVVDRAEKHFPRLQLASLVRWRQRFLADARARLGAAQAALAAADFDAARAAAIAAISIDPQSRPARDLLRQIQAAAPEMRVGVTQFSSPPPRGVTPKWAEARVAPLVDPTLARMEAFAAEGGVYKSPFGELATSDSGLETELTLSADAVRAGITADAVVRTLLEQASEDNPRPDDDFAAALAAATIVDGRSVRLQWRRPSLHPEAFFDIPLRSIVAESANAAGAGLWFDGTTRAGQGGATTSRIADRRYERPTPKRDGVDATRPHSVVERLYADDDAALAALIRGDVDAIDRVPPWQLAQARDAPGLVVAPYALPTVHVLIPRRDNPLLATREFRRALCYALDRESIVRDILLAGEPESGFTVLSGVLPAGRSLSDPAGYGYDSSLAPRPYEPRLAALLADVSRATLAKRDREERKARGEVVEEPDPGKEPTPPPAQPLVLAHPADPLARVACQAIKLQLDRVNIPTKLVELSAQDDAEQPAYDLLYAELVVHEPLTDARDLLGAGGLAVRASSLMTAALDELATSQNWNDARGRLREIHRIASYDLPVIPLWQTVNHFAYRDWLSGVGAEPVALYQHIDQWRKQFAE